MFIFTIFILTRRDIGKVNRGLGEVGWVSCELILILEEFYSGDEILAKPASSPPYEQSLIQS